MSNKEYTADYEKFSPDVIPVNSDNYQDEFLYGKSIEGIDYNVGIKNKPNALYASIEATGTQNIPDNTNTTATGLSTKVGDTTMTATADQITITQSGNYILSAYCFCGWSSSVIFRIVKNGTSITPHFRAGTTSASANTPFVNTMQTLVSGDVITMTIYQNSGVSQTLQNMYLAVAKL